MDVGINVMKIFFLALILSFCQSCAVANENIIFGGKLSLSKSCELSIDLNNLKLKHKPEFTNKEKCRLVTHDGTDIINIHYINGMYVLFIESNYEEGSNCLSEYTAIGFSKDQKLHTTKIIKKSRSCHQGQEAQSFEYFAVKLKSK